MIFKIIGCVGLILLMLSVVFHGKKQRMLWMISASCLAIYSVYIRDVIFGIVNFWVVSVNAYFLIKWRRK